MKTQLRKLREDITYNLVLINSIVGKLEARKDMPQLRIINSALMDIVSDDMERRKHETKR